MAYELELQDLIRIHPFFHVALLKPAVPDPFTSRNTGPPELVLIYGEEEFEIESILDCRKRGN